MRGAAVAALAVSVSFTDLACIRRTVAYGLVPAADRTGISSSAGLDAKQTRRLEHADKILRSVPPDLSKYTSEISARIRDLLRMPNGDPHALGLRSGISNRDRNVLVSLGFELYELRRYPDSANIFHAAELIDRAIGLEENAKSDKSNKDMATHRFMPRKYRFESVYPND